MSINVIIFGQIVDITGTGSLKVENVADTAQLIERLTSTYPALRSAKYAVAVDKKIVTQNTPLSHDSTIALLPPFSGG